MATQGKCVDCNINYNWATDYFSRKKNEIPLKKTKCPKCGNTLRRSQTSLDMKRVSVESVRF